MTLSNRSPFCFVATVNLSAFLRQDELCSGFRPASPQLTQVLAVEGRLTQQLCETGHVPEAQVDSLTRQRVHAMSSVAAKRHTHTHNQLTKLVPIKTF